MAAAELHTTGVDTFRLLSLEDSVIASFNAFANSQNTRNFRGLADFLSLYLATFIAGKGRKVELLNEIIDFSQIVGLKPETLIGLIANGPDPSFVLRVNDDNYAFIPKAELMDLFDLICREVEQIVESQITHGSITPEFRETLDQEIGDKYNLLNVFGVRTLLLRYIIGSVFKKVRQSEV